MQKRSNAWIMRRTKTHNKGFEQSKGYEVTRRNSKNDDYRKKQGFAPAEFTA